MATTKKNLIDRIAAGTRKRQVLVKRVIQQFFDEVVAELARGNRLEFRDFGVFETRTTPPRMAQNPRTLKRVRVEARQRVVFRAGKSLETQLNHGLQP
jgi:nucleoid DNA-binding protein